MLTLFQKVGDQLMMDLLMLCLFVSTLGDYKMTYKTDGIIVEHSNGGCMGIFSATSLLNDKCEAISKLTKALESIDAVLCEHVIDDCGYDPKKETS